jgi:hypothetical protein
MDIRTIIFVDMVAKRLCLTRQQERLKQLYAEGGIDESQYCELKPRVAAILATLPEA